MARNTQGDRPKMHRLRTLRLERALTQEDLAQAAGVSAGTITRLEAGKRPAYPTTVRKLATALGVKVEVLTRCGPPDTQDTPR